MTRALDALVAEEVLKNVPEHGCPQAPPGAVPCIDCIPAYSTSIADAWSVVEHLTPADDFDVEYRVTVACQAGAVCEVEILFDGPDGHEREVHVDDDSAPLAICLAALRACGVTEERINDALAA